MLTTMDIIDRDNAIDETIRHRKDYGASLSIQIAQNFALVVHLQADAELLKSNITTNEKLIAALKSSKSTAHHESMTNNPDMQVAIDRLPIDTFISPSSAIGDYLTRKFPTSAKSYGFWKTATAGVIILDGPADHYARLPEGTPAMRGSLLAQYIIETHNLYEPVDYDAVAFIDHVWRFGVRPAINGSKPPVIDTPSSVIATFIWQGLPMTTNDRHATSGESPATSLAEPA